MHADLNTAILVLGFIASIASNKLDLARVETRLDKLEADLRAELKNIRHDLQEFYRILGKHEGIIETLEKRK